MEGLGEFKCVHIYQVLRRPHGTYENCLHVSRRLNKKWGKRSFSLATIHPGTQNMPFIFLTSMVSTKCFCCHDLILLSEQLSREGRWYPCYRRCLREPDKHEGFPRSLDRWVKNKDSTQSFCPWILNSTHPPNKSRNVLGSWMKAWHGSHRETSGQMSVTILPDFLCSGEIPPPPYNVCDPWFQTLL